MKILIILLFLWFSPQVMSATHNEAWTMFLSQKHFGAEKQYGLGLSTMPRYSFKSNDFYQNLIGITGSYKINSSFTILIGFVEDVGSDSRIKEKRYLTDLLYFKLNSNGKLLLRSRFEYRVFSGAKEDGIRWRLMGRYDFSSLGKWGGFSPFVMNEFLFSLKKQSWSNQMGFMQDRFYLGGRGEITKNLKIDLSFLAIYNQVSKTSDRYVFAPFFALLHSW